MEKERIRTKKLFLLDLDGTLYLGDRLFSGTPFFLRALQRTGRQYRFLTNNSSKGLDRYVEKLRRLGVAAEKKDFLSSVQATSRLLKAQYANKRIYVFGTRSLFEELQSDGHNVTCRLEDGIDVLLLGFDTELTFEKLEHACVLLGRGATYLATNPDLVCPTEYGYVPDCGAVTEMLYHATGRRPQVIGKPQPEMLLLAMEQAGASKDETVIVGDRLYTDIASGIHAGVSTALVLSGESTEADAQASAFRPDWIFSDISEITKYLQDVSGGNE